jgi:microcystin-dependent protein
MAMPPLVFRQFFDDAGAPLANGNLYTYVTGTTTPLATYSNAALSVENANPIVLDDSGRCDLYLAAPPTAYRFRLEDSDGGLVDEQDDIVGMTAPLDGDFVPIEGDVTMTGLFELSGNATANLNPVPLQQVSTLIAAATESLEEVAAAAVPIGSVLAWVTGSVPSGYLALEGGTASRATYATLFALWGTAFGVGDGSTTFGLPDTRAYFLRGWDNGRGVDSGRAIATFQLDALQNITGEIGVINGGVTTASGAFDDNGTSTNHVNSGVSGVDSGVTFDASRVARTAAETRPHNFSVRYIVKAL